MRKIVILLLLGSILVKATPAHADTHEQNTLESACLLLVAGDFVAYGIPQFLAWRSQYALCGVVWLVSWLPDPVQAIIWSRFYPCSLHILADFIPFQWDDPSYSLCK